MFNTLRPRQNGRHFADDIFKYIFLNKNAWISLKISLKFVPRVQINNILALVQIMAWRRLGDKPWSEPMMVLYWRIYASLGLNELIELYCLIASQICNRCSGTGWYQRTSLAICHDMPIKSAVTKESGMVYMATNGTQRSLLVCL